MTCRKRNVYVERGRRSLIVEVDSSCPTLLYDRKIQICFPVWLWQWNSLVFDFSACCCSVFLTCFILLLFSALYPCYFCLFLFFWLCLCLFISLFSCFGRCLLLFFLLTFLPFLFGTFVLSGSFLYHSLCCPLPVVCWYCR